MKRVLSIGAHPDDIEIGCCGTEILLKQKGYEIIHVIITSGEEGSISKSKQELKSIREKEAKNAANVIGVNQVIFLGFPDGLTALTKEMKIQLIHLIRTLQPEIVFTHAKSDLFPDHQIVHQLSLSAMTAAKGPWYPDAKGVPYAVSQIYGYEVWNPITHHQAAVGIESTIAKKIEALNCYISQIHSVDYVSAVKGLAAYRGAMTMKGKFAEVFEVLHCEIPVL